MALESGSQGGTKKFKVNGGKTKMLNE